MIRFALCNIKLRNKTHKYTAKPDLAKCLNPVNPPPPCKIRKEFFFFPFVSLISLPPHKSKKKKKKNKTKKKEKKRKKGPSILNI